MVQIWLDSPIVRPTTFRDSPDFATEVALLSRNIVFEGGEDDITLHGGHMRIWYTPNVTQSIVGVDIRNFGQQGTIGRYPIHFHFCGDASGSVVAKNTIRQSNQRCVSAHGTNNLEIFQNVAYDVYGHCFYTEDGIETGNRFIQNLGAQIKSPERLLVIDGKPESDSDPAVFWITNPNNSFINNVAAGSQSVGYWIHPFFRGERAHLFPGYVPSSQALGVFDQNVAHSCGDGKRFHEAVRTYATDGFHSPKQLAHLTRMRLYRNKNRGFMLHKNRNYVVSDSIIADNDVGMDVDRTDGVVFRDSVIIGVSQLYRNLMKSQGAGQICRQGQIIGLDMHTWMLSSEYGGATLANITISGFDDAASIGCAKKSIRVDPLNLEQNQFEQFSTFRDVHLEDGVNGIDFCLTEDAGIDTVHWIDLDGSLSPPNTVQPTGASTILSNGPDILRFVDQAKCTINTNGCYSYCRDTCFRSIRYEVRGTVMNGYVLKACRKDDSKNCSIFHGSRRSSTEPQSFLAHLPVGNSYNLVFLDKSGQEVTPTSALKEIPVTNLCPDTSGPFAVELVAKLP